MNQLYQNENDCQMIIDTLPIAICMLDRQGIVQYTNKAFEANMGHGFIEKMEKGPGDLLACVNSFEGPDGCGSGAACMECRLRQYINVCLEGSKKEDFIEMPFTLIRDGVGEKRWFKIHIMSMLLEKKGMLLISLQDITFYKRNSLKLLQNKKIAEETNRAKSMFLANMSHEIRTPLNGLIGMLELTLLTELKEDQRENLEVARYCADSLLTLINDILDISKVENDKVVLEERRFDIRELLRNIVDIHTPKVEEKNLEFICNIEESVPTYIKGDAFRLQQVLNNLLSNAVKFTDQGSIQFETKVLCRSKDSYTLTFTVEDTGVGILQKDLKYLFKIFSQVDGSYTRRYGGTGLGLAISQKLVNLMGGEIKVKSQKGKGSLFYFTIQMDSAEEADQEAEKRQVLAAEKKTDRILLVEDDKTNQLVLKKLLEQLGYDNAETADDGYEAIRKFEKSSFDLILMDIGLPEMDGVETTRIIREKEKAGKSHIPIIAVTAFAQETDKERFLKMGMDGYVCKPVELYVLKQELELFSKKIREPEAAEKDRLQEIYKALGHTDLKAAEVKAVTEADRSYFQNLLKEVETAGMAAVKDKAYYIVAEKKIHEMKIKARNKNYQKLESTAFKIELAARRGDAEAVLSLCGDFNKLLKIG